MNRIKTTYVYTDGSAINNSRREIKGKTSFGGIGIFFADGDERNLAEPFYQFPITNQRTEIKSATKAIEIFIRTKTTENVERLVICTDSEYLIKCMTQYIRKWKYNMWKTANGKDVKNKDLLYELDHIVNLYKNKIIVEYKHIKAHRIEPKIDKKSQEYKDWYGNFCADKLSKIGSLIAKKV